MDIVIIVVIIMIVYHNDFCRDCDTSDAIVYVMFTKWELSVDDGFVVVKVAFFNVSCWFLL